MQPHYAATEPLALFQKMSARAASAVIASYSTSFSLATRLLPPAMRTDISNLYALVRLADEVVDGTAAAAGLTPTAQAQLLSNLEAEAQQVRSGGFSLNPVLVAFGETAYRVDFDPAELAAFFAAMQMDLAPKPHTLASLQRYIYGSAEVIGLMCLAIFEYHSPPCTDDPARRQVLRTGARALGAAFQKINFLRDYAADTEQLGRNYLSIFPDGSPAPDGLTAPLRDAWVADIAADLKLAAAAIDLLPRSAGVAVRCAYELFSALNTKLANTEVTQLRHMRVSVPAPHKAQLIAKTLLNFRKDSR